LNPNSQHEIIHRHLRPPTGLGERSQRHNHYAGVSAWRSLSVRQYPRSENASVTVATVYVGASAEVVRGFVTTAIERSIASAPRGILRRLIQRSKCARSLQCPEFGGAAPPTILTWMP